MPGGRFCAIIVRNNLGECLFLHFTKKPTHRWRFPGGKVEEGEFLIATAARELREEVGIEPLSLYLHSTHTEQIDDGTWTGYFFVCDHFEGFCTNVEGEKHDDIRFISPHALSDSDSPPKQLALARSMSL